MNGELIWAFDQPQRVGSICSTAKHRFYENQEVDASVPMYILREATREEWEADTGHSNHSGPLYFYAVSVD